MENLQQAIDNALIERHTRPVWETLKSAHVGIAGLGGLGSNIAVMLTRLGVGQLTLADFDRVDMTNLNRQHYMLSHLGQPKTEALARQLHDINPFVTLKLHPTRITEDNAAEIFSGCSIVCEAFDRPEAKALLVNTLLAAHPEQKLVAASGMAGYGSANDIRTNKVMKHLYICGDGYSGIEDDLSLMAPRAALCAAHQANMVLRLLLGIEAP